MKKYVYGDGGVGLLYFLQLLVTMLGSVQCHILYFVGSRTRLMQSPYLDWVPWTMDTAVQH